MLRPCAKCGNRNHISASVCPCGNRLIGWQELAKELPLEFEKAAVVPTEFRRNSFPTRSPILSDQPLPPARNLALEKQKQAIRESLLAEESGKPANGKLKINVKRCFIAASSVILIGAMLAVLSGFIGIAEDSEARQTEKEQASLRGNNLAPDTLYSVTNNSAGKTSIQGRVVDVGSGDTLTVADNSNQEYKIKLEGIDAPELEQDFGRESQKNLFALVFGKTVQVNLQNIDIDNSTIGKVLLNGKNVSSEQLKAGLAWHDENAADEQSENDLYALNETDARISNSGLWATANPLAPWEYRNKANDNQNENAVIASDSNGEIQKAVPGAKSKAKTTAQETRYEAESQRASTETAHKQVYIKSSKSNSIPPSPRVVTPAFAGFENITIIVPRNSTARCGDGTLSYNTTRSGNCAGRGGVAEWFNGSASSPPAKTLTRPRKYNPDLPRVTDCFVIEGGKKVYLDRKLCGN